MQNKKERFVTLRWGESANTLSWWSPLEIMHSEAADRGGSRGEGTWASFPQEIFHFFFTIQSIGI